MSHLQASPAAPTDDDPEHAAAMAYVPADDAPSQMAAAAVVAASTSNDVESNTQNTPTPTPTPTHPVLQPPQQPQPQPPQPQPENQMQPMHVDDSKQQQQQQPRLAAHADDGPRNVFFAPFTKTDDSSQTSSSQASSVQSLSSTMSFSVGKENKPEVVTAIYISIFAMLGALTRMVTAQFFGEECHSPGTVGWLAASAPLCVTADGVSEQGGIIFADLPANLLGSFIMGLFQNGKVLDLAIPMPIAWLAPTHPFQKMKIIHKAITTGYCGSVTTFSGWNSAMVVQIFGTGSNRQTHIFNAIFGYIIGVETAVGSYVCGKSVARRLHQMVNPKMAVEEAAMKIRREEGVYLNHNLPDFERRYLHNLYMETSVVREARDFYGDLFPVERLDSIEKWRKSTKKARRINHPLLPLLKEIENMALVHNFPISDHLAEAAHAHDWDIDALRDWQSGVCCSRLPSMRSSTLTYDILNQTTTTPKSPWLSISISAAILTAAIAFQVAGLCLLTGEHSYTITNRNMAYALLFAPFGALMRWKLSLLNGKVSYRGYKWFPLGTFSANLIGSIVSIAAIAVEYNLNSAKVNSFWLVGSIRAIKVGFAGCLTTVSTFVAEFAGFMKNSDHAYPYMLMTIVSCGSVGCFIYGLILWMDTL